MLKLVTVLDKEYRPCFLIPFKPEKQWTVNLKLISTIYTISITLISFLQDVIVRYRSTSQLCRIHRPSPLINPCPGDGSHVKSGRDSQRARIYQHSMLALRAIPPGPQEHGDAIM